MMYRTSLAAALIVLPLWAAATMPAYACSCLPATMSEQVPGADLVVLGTVENIEPIGDPPPEDEMDVRSLLVTVDVEEYLKGSGPSTIVHVDAGGGGALCQVGSEVGTAYLLFLGQPDEDGHYATNICAGSGVATDDLVAMARQALQEPAPTPTVGGFPPTGSGGGSTGEGPVALLAATSAIAAVGLLSLGVAAKLRRSS